LKCVGKTAHGHAPGMRFADVNTQFTPAAMAKSRPKTGNLLIT
jgi:hypothetical protein